MRLDIPKKDAVSLRHMLDAAEQALLFSIGRSRGSLDADPMYRRAVTNCIQEIGEAAVNISDETREKVPTLPWTKIIRMRNRLVHAYFAIGQDYVWEVIADDLRPLIEAINATLTADGPI